MTVAHLSTRQVTRGGAIFYPRAVIWTSWYFQWSFEPTGLSVQEKRIEVNFQDGNRGGHLWFQIGTILTIFDLRPNNAYYQVSSQFGLINQE